jgi:hypothetical protein
LLVGWIKENTCVFFLIVLLWWSVTLL